MPLIRINARKQFNSNWCWATCAQMVLETYGFETGTSQTAVVSITTGGHVGNEQGSLREICAAVGKFSGQAVMLDQRERPLTVEELRIVMGAGGLVVVDRGGHMVILQGVGNTTSNVWVCDPDPAAPPKPGETGGDKQDYATFAEKWVRSGYVYAWKMKSGGSGGTLLPPDGTT